MTRALPLRPPPQAFHPDLPDRMVGRPDGRIVIRDWGDRHVWVSTVCPDRGEIPRGRLRVVPGGWEWIDVTCARGVYWGDFLDAERVLLRQTPSLD